MFRRNPAKIHRIRRLGMVLARIEGETIKFQKTAHPF